MFVVCIIIELYFLLTVHTQTKYLPSISANRPMDPVCGVLVKIITHLSLT